MSERRSKVFSGPPTTSNEGKLNNELEWYYSLGFNLIPVPKGRKGAVIRWKQYEKTKAPKIKHEYEGNIAVVLGVTSGNLVDIDCDTEELFNSAQKILPETLTTRSYRGGHLYYRTDYPVRKFTLDIPKYGKLEVAGQGQISILPPSAHPKGGVYKFVKKIPPKTWHGDFRQELIELIEKALNVKIKREPVNIEKILQGVPEGERDESAIRLATWYRRQGLTKDETLQKMQEWNLKNKPPLEDSIIEIKVESAYKPEKPYAYKFVEPRKEKKFSCGEDLPDKIFEQIKGEQFIVYNKATGEITKRKTVEGFRPIEQRDILWDEQLVDDIEDFESKEKLWGEIRQYLWEHIDLPGGYDTLTAWVLASWTPERWHAIPYLFFYGPAGSGKTWALEVLNSIGFRPFLTASITVASLFRVCDHYKPTLFLDETETYMMKDRREIIYLLNSGYRKGSKAVRTEETKGGYKTRTFKTFGFKALSGTRELIETLKSRCIIFNMSEATRDVKTRIDEKRAETLRKKLLAYRFKTLSEKEECQTPEAVKALKGRLRELFEPLIIVAPPSAKQSIIAEAEKIRKSIQEEQKASDEAIVFKAIVEAHEENLEEKKITIKQILEILNEGWPTGEWSSISVGMICSRLGFKRTMKRRKRAIFWNQRLAERLARKYYPEWVPTQKTLM